MDSRCVVAELGSAGRPGFRYECKDCGQRFNDLTGTIGRRSIPQARECMTHKPRRFRVQIQSRTSMLPYPIYAS